MRSVVRVHAALPSAPSWGPPSGGVLTGVAAKPGHHHDGQKKHRRAGTGSVQAQASAEPGPGKNLDGCDFSGQDFSGRSLRASSLRGTLFTSATLRGTNLSDSNAKGANFHDATLCGANLSSSTLTNADFTGADLTKADLHASACKGRRLHRRHVLSDQDLQREARQLGLSEWQRDHLCADADCPASAPTCRNHQCVSLVCPGGGDPCFPVNCIRPGCGCATHIDGSGVCITGDLCAFCASDTDCGPGTVCIRGASCCAGGTACAGVAFPSAGPGGLTDNRSVKSRNSAPRRRFLGCRAANPCCPQRLRRQTTRCVGY